MSLSERWRRGPALRRSAKSSSGDRDESEGDSVPEEEDEETDEAASRGGVFVRLGFVGDSERVITMVAPLAGLGERLESAGVVDAAGVDDDTGAGTTRMRSGDRSRRYEDASAREMGLVLREWLPLPLPKYSSSVEVIIVSELDGQSSEPGS
jgi:hypothetical protein